MTSLPSRRTILATAPVALGVAALVTPAIPADDGDHEIRAVVARMRATDAAYTRANEEHEAAWRRYRDLGGRPEIPDALFRREGDDDLGLWSGTVRRLDGPDVFDRSAIEFYRARPRLKAIEVRRPVTLADGFSEEEVASGINVIVRTTREPWPEAQARADEVVAAWDAYVAEETRCRAVSGLDAASKASEACLEAYTEARKEVAATPARTLEGIALKVSVVMGFYDGLVDLAEEIELSDYTADAQIALSIVRDLAARPTPLSA